MLDIQLMASCTPGKLKNAFEFRFQSWSYCLCSWSSQFRGKPLNVLKSGLKVSFWKCPCDTLSRLVLVMLPLNTAFYLPCILLVALPNCWVISFPSTKVGTWTLAVLVRWFLLAQGWKQILWASSRFFSPGPMGIPGDLVLISSVSLGDGQSKRDSSWWHHLIFLKPENPQSFHVY